MDDILFLFDRYLNSSLIIISLIRDKKPSYKSVFVARALGKLTLHVSVMLPFDDQLCGCEHCSSGVIYFIDYVIFYFVTSWYIIFAKKIYRCLYLVIKEVTNKI